MDRKGNRRTSKVEQVKRLDECMRKIIDENLNYTMFVDWFMEHYDMSKHNAYKYWVKCWGIIKSRFALEHEQLVNKQLFQLYELFKDTKEITDYNTARKILEDIRKLQGIDVPDKLNVKHEGRIDIKFGDEE